MTAPNSQVHVGWLEGGTAVFAFRGTATRQDGLQDVKIFSRNIDYLQELYPGVKAHLGKLSLQCTHSHTVSPTAQCLAVSIAANLAWVKTMMLQYMSIQAYRVAAAPAPDPKSG